MFSPNTIGAAIGVVAIAFAGLAQAQTPISYEQALAECQSIAQQQTGASTTTQPATGGRQTASTAQTRSATTKCLWGRLQPGI